MTEPQSGATRKTITPILKETTPKKAAVKKPTKKGKNASK